MDIHSYTTCTGLCLNWSLTTSHYQVSLNQITQPAPFPNCCRAGRAAIMQTPDGRRDTEASSSLTSKTAAYRGSIGKSDKGILMAIPCTISQVRVYYHNFMAYLQIFINLCNFKNFYNLQESFHWVPISVLQRLITVAHLYCLKKKNCTLF